MATPFRISRRTLLRGAGAIAIALPALEVMTPVGAQPPLAPRRLLVWTTPNGTVSHRWRPRAGATESDFELSEILAPLAAHKSDLVVIQRLVQHGGHAHHCIASLTGRPVIDSGFPDLRSTGISLDQYLATKIGADTLHPVLNLSVNMTQNRETVGCVSWRAAGVPAPPENDPYRVFARLFTPGEPSGTAARDLITGRRSVLDSVREQSCALSRRASATDRMVLENYCESVRELEQTLVRLEEEQATCEQPEIPADPSTSPDNPFWLQERNVPTLINVNRRLITAAFRCDLTRVITLNLSNDGGAGRNHAWIEGIEHGQDWHGHSHAVETGAEEGLVKIEQWYYARLAELATELKSITDVDGEPLLRNTLIMTNNEYGPNGPDLDVPPHPDTGQRNNLSHYARNIPYVLIGQAGGALRTGRNLIYDLPASSAGERASNDFHMHGQPHTKLLVSILNLMGVEDQRFGDPEAAQGPLTGLL